MKALDQWITRLPPDNAPKPYTDSMYSKTLKRWVSYEREGESITPDLSIHEVAFECDVVLEIDTYERNLREV